MKKLMIAAAFATSLLTGIEAAPTDTVTQADLKALIERIAKLESENQAQARRIAELESANKKTEIKLTESTKKFELQTETLNRIAKVSPGAVDEGTTTNSSGRVFTTSQGFKYYLADASARIFEPLSESGLKMTPYGYLVFEGVYSDHGLDMDYTTDFVRPKSDRGYHSHNSTLSMQDSILGLQFETPEAKYGWKFTGRAEFDLAGGNADDYAFHWRHLYVNAEHESGWSILFGQTWHLWKIVTPSEIDGAWMENAGHPYRRSPQIRVTKKWDFEDSSFEARLGFVKNGPNASTDRDEDGTLDSTQSAWGWVEGALVYDHDAAWQDDHRRWLVGLGGMYGRDRSRRATLWDENGQPLDFDGEEDDYDSKMLMLAASIPMWKFTLTGQLFTGTGLGRIQAGCAQNVVYQPWQERGTDVGTYGGFIDLGYQISEDWSAAVGYGFDDPVNSDVEGGTCGGYPSPSILFNDRLYIDVFYQIVDNFKVGLEYARLSTTYDGDGTSGANRIQFSAFYDF